MTNKKTKRHKVKRKSAPRKNPSEKEFFIEKIEGNLRTIAYLIDRYKTILSEKDAADIQRHTGKASSIIKDIIVSSQLKPTL